VPGGYGHRLFQFISDANDWFASEESCPSKEISEQAPEKAKQSVFPVTNILWNNLLIPFPPLIERNLILV
jgi:hypothetical protein